MNASDPLGTLKEHFGEAVRETLPFRGETTIIVDAQKIAEVGRFLHDTPGLEYKFLSDITGIDYYPEEPRFGLAYHLLCMRFNRRLRLKVYWSDGDEPVPSVTGIWKSANWEEREAYDMYGIEFSGHPDLRRILMAEDWEGFPGRKDYPLGYEVVQFSFNFDDVNKHKPYAKE